MCPAPQAVIVFEVTAESAAKAKRCKTRDGHEG